MKRRKHTVRLLRAAEDDFTEIVTYIAAQRPEAAEALAQRIEKNLRLLALNPYLGRVSGDASLVDLGYRYLVVQDYLIFLHLRGANDLRSSDHSRRTRLSRTTMSPRGLTS
ncbi:MAG TPA: type II toxin-antitoxin system RelE/ParE family toxin [Blastocatellia bacterium]|nr:type II toxin-antitoxin system RelE/ParE family toxin [Blastocatellia bacterium]